MISNLGMVCKVILEEAPGITEEISQDAIENIFMIDNLPVRQLRTLSVITALQEQEGAGSPTPLQQHKTPP